MNYIYIISKKGEPLMPTTRQSHIRHLLKEGLAVVINGSPFTVRLKYDTPDITQELHEGMDPGRQNIGEGISDESGRCVYMAHTSTNNKAVHQAMVERKAYRMERRRHKRQRKQRKAIATGNVMTKGQDAILRHRKPCRSVNTRYPGMEETTEAKVIHGKEAKFNNRTRDEGWLPPSGRQLIDIHVKTLDVTTHILPITDFTFECNSFDFQKLENEDISDWQHGPLYGFKDYKEYICHQQEGRCLIYGKNGIDQYHHIIPRSKGGSDTVSNIAGLCDHCHNSIMGVHKSEDAEHQLMELKAGTKKKYEISLLNSVMPYLVQALREYCEAHEIRFHISDGYETFLTRERYGIPKGHAHDGYAISLAGRDDIKAISYPAVTVEKQHYKKKSSNNINALGQRGYYLNGRLVAVNRHKAEGQMADSLEEFRQKHGENMTSGLTVKPAKRTYTAHREGRRQPFHTGDVIKYDKYDKTTGEHKTFVFVAESIKMNNNTMCHHSSKNAGFKFCRHMKSGCLQYRQDYKIRRQK